MPKLNPETGEFVVSFQKGREARNVHFAMEKSPRPQLRISHIGNVRAYPFAVRKGRLGILHEGDLLAGDEILRVTLEPEIFDDASPLAKFDRE